MLINTFFIQDQSRATNMCGGWHHAFSLMSGCHHPTIYKFFDLLQKEQILIEEKIIKCNANVAPPNGKRKFINRESAIKRAMDVFNSSQNETNSLTDGESGDEEEEEVSQSNQRRNTACQRRNNPSMVLLNSIAHITHL